MKTSPISHALTLVLITLSAGAPAATLVVAPDGSGDHPTIQAAVAAAQDGDEVVLLAGTFAGPGNRDIVIQERSLTIRSAAGDPTQTIIDCGGDASEPHRFLHIAGASGTVTVDGLTITGGHAGGRIPGGGGLLITNGASPVIARCIFVDNHAAMSWDNAGGAAYVDGNCDASFTACEFRANSGYFGGAVALNHYSDATFTDCRFEDNEAGRGGAIWGNSTTKVGCVLVGNSAEQGGAIWGNGYNPEVSISCTYALNSTLEGGAIHAQTGYGAAVVLDRTIVAYSSQGTGVHAAAGVPLEVVCTDIFGNMGGDWVGTLAPFANVDGNIAIDPCFCDLDSGELTVCADSFCLPAYNPGGCSEVVGALGVGCPECGCGGQVSTEGRSWSEVRGLFLR